MADLLFQLPRSMECHLLDIKRVREKGKPGPLGIKMEPVGQWQPNTGRPFMSLLFLLPLQSY